MMTSMAPPSADQADATRKRAPVLLVDDDALMRLTLGRTIEQAGFQVLAASSGEAALDVLRRRPVAAIVADHYMPGMNGLQFFTIAQLGWPGVPRILVTGHADQNLAIQAINQGEVLRFLTKPVDKGVLAEVLRRATE